MGVARLVVRKLGAGNLANEGTGKPRVKLGDIARAVGVHPSTASRVLNPETRDMVSSGLAERILKVADEMGYRPDPFALGLRTRKSFTVGVMIPDLTNPVFPPIILGIERVLKEAGYTAILANSDIYADHDREVLEKLRARRVDGLILATAHRQDPVVDECLAEGVPLVLVNRKVDGDDVFAVVTDDAWGMKLAVSHVVEKGHSRIAHIAGSQGLSTGYGRYQGFLDAMRGHGLEPDPELIVICQAFTESEGKRAIETLLDGDKSFTAVIAGNDLLALGCYDVFAERGIRCPEDISVTGFNDMPFIDKFDPPMATIRIPLGEMGEEGARLLLDIIRHPETAPVTRKLKPEFIARGSTAVAKVNL